MANMDLDAYKKALEDKSEVPSFAPAVKTQYSRNITIEDWNSIVYSVQGLLSDMSATAEYTIDADVASTYETKSDAGDKYVSLDNKIIALDGRIAPYEKALDLKGKTYALPSSAKSDVDVFSADSAQTDIRSPMGSSSVILTNGKAEIVGDTTTIKGSNIKIIDSSNDSEVAIFNIAGSTFNRSTAFNGSVFLKSIGFVNYVVNSDTSITNKKYVDDSISTEALNRDQAISASEQRSAVLVNNEVTRATGKESDLQGQIDAINASQNFVATYARKADMPKASSMTGLEPNDCVLVLKDESHQYQAYVYKWSSTAWIEVGPMGDYYTKQQIDEKFDLDQHIYVDNEGYVCVDYDKLPVRA